MHVKDGYIQKQCLLVINNTSEMQSTSVLFQRKIFRTKYRRMWTGPKFFTIEIPLQDHRILKSWYAKQSFLATFLNFVFTKFADSFSLLIAS